MSNRKKYLLYNKKYLLLFNKIKKKTPLFNLISWAKNYLNLINNSSFNSLSNIKFISMVKPLIKNSKPIHNNYKKLPLIIIDYSKTWPK